MPQPTVSGDDIFRQEWRERLGVAPGERILLFLGRLHSMKRPIETLSAFGKARANGVHLVMVGPDEQYRKADLEEYARRNGIARVHVLGPVYGQDKWALYRASNAFINLSVRENFGFTVAEALGTRLPVILSPGNDLIDEIRDTQCGWFLDDAGEQPAADAIRSFASASPDTVREMGARGQNWALCHASMERFRSSLLSLCREVTGHD